MKNIKFTRERFALFAIILISAVLNFANLGIEGYGNSYYAAGVKSMLASFRNFFFVASDPGGFVSLDKPPLGFWIQAISAKIFGFSGWSILLPQALAGVISVVVLYYIVKRSFGKISALISALCLAITPVFVAASRNNTIDNLLVMTLLFACMFLSRAAEKGKFKYLLISLVLVGVGFNIKMLQAYMVIPAIYITYLISTAAPLKKRLKHLIVSTVVLVAVSLCWAFAVDMVPSSSRPFVGSSTNNTVMELIFGHNGLERLSSTNGGMGGGPGGNRQEGNRQEGNRQEGNSSSSNTQNMPQNGNNPGGAMMQPPGGSSGAGGGQFQNGSSGENGGNQSQMPPGAGEGMGGAQGRGTGGPGGNGLSGNFGGQTEAGVTRLFSKNVLSDQIVWFLPLSIFGFIAAAIVEKLKFPFDSKKKLDLVMWILWLLPEFIYFSYTKGLFHQYYLTMMAPPIAALSGIGITYMWKLYRESGAKAWLLPAAFIVEGLVHLLMLSYFASSLPAAAKGAIIAAVTLCFASSALLIIYRLIKRDNLNVGKNINFAKALSVLALVGILVTPALGSSAAVVHGVNGSMPAAGLELLSNSSSGDFMRNSGGRNGSSSENKKLIEFLDSHVENERYALVVSSSNAGASMIIESGKSIMPLGGFSGSDKILTLNQFKEMVKKGEIRYVLTGGMGRDSQDIMSWVQKNGKLVPESQWKNTTSSGSSATEETGKAEGTNEISGTDEAANTSRSDGTNEDNNVENKNSWGNGFGGMGMNSQSLYDLKGTIK